MDYEFLERRRLAAGFSIRGRCCTDMGMVIFQGLFLCFALERKRE